MTTANGVYDLDPCAPVAISAFFSRGAQDVLSRICDTHPVGQVGGLSQGKVDGVLLDRLQWGQSVVTMFQQGPGGLHQKPHHMKDGERRGW